MAANMKAAFTLTLEDKLTAGLKKIGTGFEDLKRAGKELGLGKLGESGADTLRTLTEEARNLTSGLRSVESVAERSSAALRRLGSTTFRPVAQAVTSFGRGVGRIGRGMMGEGGLTSAAQAVGGAAALVEPSRAYADYESISRRSAITEGFSGAGAAVETKRLMGIFNKDALKTGQSSESISEAYLDLISQHIDPARAMAALPFHSRAATAYGVTTKDLGHTLGAFLQSFHLKDDEVGGAFASLALASKSGLFKYSDFNQYLPGVAGMLSGVGMQGRSAVDWAAASLEIATKNTGNPQQAETNLRDFIKYAFSPHGTRAFSLDSRGMSPLDRELIKENHVDGFNINKVYADGKAKGMNPLDALLTSIHKTTTGLSPEVMAKVMGAYFTNQESAQFATGVMQHWDEWHSLRQKFQGADVGMLLRDYETNRGGPQKGLDTAGEVGKQLERRLGEGFEPVIDRLGSMGKILLDAIDGLDKALPGLGNAVLQVTGGLLALSTTLAGLGLIAPVAARGAMLGLSGVGGLAAAGSAIFAPEVALPLGLGLGILGFLGLGSKYETPQNRAALDHLDRERRSLNGGPNGPTFDGFGVDGKLIDLAPRGKPIDLAPSSAGLGTGELIIHLDPGLIGQVTKPMPQVNLNLDSGGQASRPDPGQTTNRP